MSRATSLRVRDALMKALAEDFEEHGVEAVRLARIERPVEYLRIVAGLLPKEFEITDSRLAEISDDELDALLEHVRGRIAARGITSDADSREEQTIN